MTFFCIRKPSAAFLMAPALALLLGGCSSFSKDKGAPFGVGAHPQTNRLTPQRLGTRPQTPNSPLVKKTTKLAAAYRKHPENGDLALQYIYHLRALNMQEQAANVLAQAYRNTPKHPQVASEYGRLLLASGKSNQAQRVLQRTRTDGANDWRTLSALGTLAARKGRYGVATDYFNKALEQQPQRASILNNLALAMALDGKADEAENMLRNADDSGRFGPRMRQNLALVLALQGKYDEAQDVATTDLPQKQAEANIAYLRKMMKSDNVAGGVNFTDESRARVASLDDGPITTGALPDNAKAGAAPRATVKQMPPLRLNPIDGESK